MLRRYAKVLVKLLLILVALAKNKAFPHGVKVNGSFEVGNAIIRYITD